MNRRSLLQAGVAGAGLGFAGCLGSTECDDEIACFSFEYQDADDAPSRLDIEHTGGERDLLADAVYITNVSVDYESGDTKTIAWAELDDDSNPSDTINGETVQIPIGLTEIVKVLWRRDNDERIIEAWVYDDDAT